MEKLFKNANCKLMQKEMSKLIGGWTQESVNINTESTADESYSFYLKMQRF